MKKISVAIACSALSLMASAQNKTESFSPKEVERIIKVLASDEMRGRRAGSPEIDKAADFISNEFKKTGLSFYGDLKSYKQDFVMIRPKQISTSGTADGKELTDKDVLVVTSKADFAMKNAANYKVVKIEGGKRLTTEANAILENKHNTLVLVDTSYAKNFQQLSFIKRSFFASPYDHVFILGTQAPANIQVEAKHEIVEQKYTNVVGVIPGKSKKNEYVLFTGHYDHIGIGKAKDGDTIYNGANDNAAGTTAMMMLANYYKKLKNNERTLIFVAFTAEEVGGFGARYFSKQMDPATVMAMCNIEMIGTDSKWGKNSAYITGYEKSSMGDILQKNLEGSGFTFYPDPYTEQNLFYRSDNATLARLGVPAHTISTAKMEGEPHYHQASDHVETLDLPNMAKIIESIAVSMQSIVAGKDTPSRVSIADLR